MAILAVVIGGKETEYEVPEGQTLIGRHADCPITINQPTVSRRHAMIHREGSEFALEDVGSRNGTYVNDQRIEGRVTLDHDDEIWFGGAQAYFRDPDKDLNATIGSSSATVVDIPASVHLGAGPIDEADHGDTTDEIE
jgi:pSer/pThr/pTyr-binding forkhead associated (FHA) protein